MLGRALLFIVIVPLIELVLLNELLERTSLPTTILLVLLTGIVGVSLTRRQGMKAWRAVHEQMAQGKSPSKEIMDGVMILLAGAFLITPGIITDCTGFTLLVPQVRSLIRNRLTTWFKARTVATFQMNGWTGTTFDNEEVEGPSVRVVDPASDDNTSQDDPPVVPFR